MTLQGDFGEHRPFTAKRPMASTKRRTAEALGGGQHSPRAGAESDRHRAGSMAARREDQLIAILEEGTGLATGKLDRPLAALADFKQRSESGFFGSRQRAGSDQVARLEVAAVRGMVAHRLQREDRNGRDLMVIRRNGKSIGRQLMDEGLAHRYIGSKRSWC